MKNIKLLLWMSIALLTFSCTKEENRIPAIAFKTNTGYQLGDFSIAPATKYIIGIRAGESENGDKIKEFKMTRAVDDSAATVYFQKELTGAEKSDFSYDFENTSSTVSGRRVKFTFIVTSDDDISNSVSSTYYVK